MQTFLATLVVSDRNKINQSIKYPLIRLWKEKRFLKIVSKQRVISILCNSNLEMIIIRHYNEIFQVNLPPFNSYYKFSNNYNIV